MADEANSGAPAAPQGSTGSQGAPDATARAGVKETVERGLKEQLQQSLGDGGDNAADGDDDLGDGLYGNDGEGDESESSDISDGEADPEERSFVPEAPDGYELPQVEGVEWGDRDAPVLQSLFSAVHATGMNQAQIDVLGGWYQSVIAEQAKAQKAADATNRRAIREAIVEARGEDGFTSEMGKVKAHLNAMPRGLGKEIWKARLPNGRLLGEDIRFIHYFANMQGAGAPADEVREAELVKMMQDDPDQYRRTGQKELSGLRARMPVKNPQAATAPQRALLSAADQKRKAELQKMMTDDPRTYHHKGGREEYSKILEREEAARRR